MTVTISPMGLSERELDVLCLLVRGYGNGQIAAELQLSIRTVSGHIADLKQKFCVESRAGLIRFIRQNGLGC